MFCLRIFTRNFRSIKSDLSRADGAVRRFMSKTKPKDRIDFDVDRYKVIYEFRNIRLLRFFSKAIFYKVFAIPPVVLLSYSSFRENGVAPEFVVSLLAVAIVVFCAHMVVRNLIGKIYVSEIKGVENIVVSYINSKGRRINITCKPSDVSVSDHPNPMFGRFFKQVTVKDKEEKLKLHDSEKNVRDFVAYYNVFPTLV